MHHYQSARYTIYFNPDILSLCLIKLTEKIKKNRFLKSKYDHGNFRVRSWIKMDDHRKSNIRC